MDFGAKLKDKVAALQSPDAQVDLEIPGRFPYESAGAQSMEDTKWKNIAIWLHENCSTRKDPHLMDLPVLADAECMH